LIQQLPNGGSMFQGRYSVVPTVPKVPIAPIVWECEIGGSTQSNSLQQL
jgi:hypothetical protein